VPGCGGYQPGQGELIAHDVSFLAGEG